MNRTRTVFVVGMLSGAAMCALLSAWINSSAALAQTPPAAGRGAAPAGAQTAGIDDRKLESVYANYFMFSTTNDEVITDLGFVRPNSAAAAGANQPDNIFDARTRLIMTFSTAKKLHDALGILLTKYESIYGPIRTDAPTPRNVTPVLPPPK